MKRPCRACGAPLVFVRGMEGKLIPLDLRAQVFTLRKDTNGEDVAIRATSTYVTHFATCPKAADFSSGKQPQNPKNR